MVMQVRNDRKDIVAGLIWTRGTFDELSEKNALSCRSYPTELAPVLVGRTINMALLTELDYRPPSGTEYSCLCFVQVP